jgi:hypothetical protein
MHLLKILLVSSPIAGTSGVLGPGGIELLEFLEPGMWQRKTNGPNNQIDAIFGSRQISEGESRRQISNVDVI